jgi:hypothetical protein
MVHHAKVDGWVTALLGGLAGLMLALAVAFLVAGLTTGAPPLPAALGPTAGGALTGLMLWGCYRTRYEITPTALRVCFGPFHTTVPLDAIVEVFPTRNPQGAPAPSLDRLQINYRRKSGTMGLELISPKDKEAFVRDLASAAPRLRSVTGEALRLKAEGPASQGTLERL